jgi:hypothetical protein
MSKKKSASRQLDLFSCPKSELQALWEAVAEVKFSHNSVRKRLFQELQDLKESMIEIQATQSRILTYLTLVA